MGRNVTNGGGKTNCLLCFESIKSIPEVSPFLGIPGAVNCHQFGIELGKWFILSKVLEIPIQWCEERLPRENENLEGNDGPYETGRQLSIDSWFQLCKACETDVTKAWKVYQKLVEIQSRFKVIQNEIKGRMIETSVAKGWKRYDCNGNGAVKNMDDLIREQIVPAVFDPTPEPWLIEDESLQFDTFFDDMGIDDSATGLAEHFNEKIRSKSFKVPKEGQESSLVLTMEVCDSDNDDTSSLNSDTFYIPLPSAKSADTGVLGSALKTASSPKTKFNSSKRKLGPRKKYKKKVPTSTLKEVHCSICSLTFDKVRTLNQHKRDVHPQILACPEANCDFRFSTDAELNSHIKNTHDRKNDYICETCGKGFFKSEHLLTHLTVHKTTRDFICEVCGSNYNSQRNLEAHIKKYHPNTNEDEAPKQLHHCKRCPFSTPFLNVMKRHIADHIREFGHKCDQCGKCYSSDQGLKRHIRLNHPVEKIEVKCPYCFKVFGSKEYMMGHAKYHCHVRNAQLLANMEEEMKD